MSDSSPVYRGWIEAKGPEEYDFLKSLGVKVGTWITSDKCFDDCEVSSDVLAKLDPHWGRFIWGLEPK